MSTPTVIVPATDQTDHRADAYSRVAALGDLTHHLDPRLRVTMQADSFGKISALLHNEATLTDAAQLAARLGLTEHTKCPAGLGWVLHKWAGVFSEHACEVDWFDQTPGAER